MALVLLLATIPGVLLTINIARVAFFVTGDYDTPYGVAPDSRFIDRATSWVQQSLGASAEWASLAALAGFTVVILCRRYQHLPIAGWIRLAGVMAGLALALVQVAGPVTVAVGLFQLAADPTAARNISGELLYVAPLIVLSLVLAMLAALLGWVLWHARPATDGASSASPPAVSDGDGPARDSQHIYRRPT